MLPDGVFAIAIALVAIEIRVPETSTLGETLAPPGSDLGTYLIRFPVIASSWVSHRDPFARLHRVERVFTALALGMLRAVALIPAAAHASQVRDLVRRVVRATASAGD